jgi:hypothetical protein
LGNERQPIGHAILEGQYLIWIGRNVG